MASTVFMADNLVPQSSISATTGTVNSQFPLENIQVDATTTVARVQTSGDTVVLDIQLAEDTSIDTIAVVGSNLDGLGYSACVARHSLTSDFSTATDITVDLSQEFSFGYAFFTAATARNVQLTFTNTGSFAEISKVYIGTRQTINASYSRDDFVRAIIRNDEILENQIGNRFVNVLNSRDEINGTYPLMEQSVFLEIESLFVNNGSYKPVWVMLDQENNLFSNGEFKLSMYSYLNNMFSHNLVGGNFYDVTIQLLEVV